MATYIVLGKFDRAAVNADIDAALDSGDGGAGAARRIADISRLDDANVKLVGYWMTSGPYDVVAEVTADTHEHLLSYLAALGFVARLSTTTLAATDQTRVNDVLGDAHTKIIGAIGVAGGGGN